MCLAIPALVKSISGQQAEVDIEGVTRDVSLQRTPGARFGASAPRPPDYTIDIIAPAEAEETLKLLKQLGEANS